jgi:drug/metabolite transporter (DMT)-like permease
MIFNSRSEETSEDAASRRKRDILGICCGLGAALLWGLQPVVSRYGVLRSLDPYDLAAIRFLVSGLILQPVLFRSGLRGIGWFGAIMIAMGAGLPYVILFNLGLTFSTASNGGVIAPGANVVISTIGLYFLAQVIPDRKRLSGIALILLGLVVVGVGRIEHLDAHALIGDLLFMLAGGIYALFAIFSQRHRISALHAAAIVSVFSLVVYAPFYLFYGFEDIFRAPLREVVIQVIVQGILVAILATWFYAKAISILGAGRAVVFVALMPVFSVAFAVPLLHEWPTRLEFAGLSLVFIGIMIALKVLENIVGRPLLARPAEAVGAGATGSKDLSRS